MRLHVVTKAEPPAVAQRFLAFLRSPEAAKIIRENGAVLVSTRTAAAQ